MENEVNIIESICSDLKDSIDDLIHQLKIMQKDIQNIKTSTSEG